MKRKRFVGLLMSLTVLFQLGFAANFTPGSKIYLDCSGFTDWESANAWFAIEFYQNRGDNNKYLEFTKTTDHIYEVTVPTGVTLDGCNIRRMNSSAAHNENSMKDTNQYWNEIIGQVAESGKNCIRITDWNAGQWTTYTPPVITPGEDKIHIESDWTAGNGQEIPYNEESGLYEYTFKLTDASTFNKKHIKFRYNGNQYLAPEASGSFYINSTNTNGSFNITSGEVDYYIDNFARNNSTITITIDLLNKEFFFYQKAEGSFNIVRGQNGFTPKTDLHQKCPVYPASVYEAGRDWTAWNGKPTAYLCSPVLNAERIASDWEMTYNPANPTYGECWEIHNVTLRSTIAADYNGTTTQDGRIYATMFTDPENGQGEEVAFTKLIITEKRNFHLTDNSGYTVGLNKENQSTPGQPFNVYLHKNDGEWVLDFEYVKNDKGEDISNMPYIGMTSYNYTVFKPGTTDGYITPNSNSTKAWTSASGWQEAYLLYDRRGNLLLDRDGYVQYSTQWPPKNKIYFSSRFKGGSDADTHQIEVSSANTMFQTRYIAKTGKGWKEEAEIETNTPGYADLKDSEEYIRYIIPHAWLLGVFKIWTGWSGEIWYNGKTNLAQWDNHINWGGEGNNKTDNTGNDFPAGNIIKAENNASNFKITSPTYFKAIEFYYNTSDPKNKSVIRTVKAYGMPRIYGQLQDGSKNATEYNIQLIESPDQFTEGETVKKCVVRRFDAISSTANPWDSNNGGWVAVDRNGNEVDRNSDDAIVSVFDFENGNFTGVSDEMKAALELNSTGEWTVEKFQSKFTKDTWFEDGELAVGRYFYGFEIIYGKTIDSATGQPKREEVKSSAIIVSGGKFANRLNAYQLVKINDKGREFIKTEFERKGMTALTDEDRAEIVYLTYSDDTDRTLYTLRADKTIRRIVSDIDRKDVMRSIFSDRSLYDWTFDTFLVGYMPDDFSRYTKNVEGDKFTEFQIKHRGQSLTGIDPIIVNNSKNLNALADGNEEWAPESRWYMTVPGEDIEDANYSWSINYPAGEIAMGTDKPIDISAGTAATIAPTRVKPVTPTATIEIQEVDIEQANEVPAQLILNNANDNALNGQELTGNYNRLRIGARVIEPNLTDEARNLANNIIGYELKVGDKVVGDKHFDGNNHPMFVFDKWDPETEMNIGLNTYYNHNSGTESATYAYGDEATSKTAKELNKTLTTGFNIEGAWGYANEEKDKYILAISKINFTPMCYDDCSDEQYQVIPEFYQLRDNTDSRHVAFVTEQHFGVLTHIPFTEPKDLVDDKPSGTLINTNIRGVYLFEVDNSSVSFDSNAEVPVAQKNRTYAPEDEKITVKAIPTEQLEASVDGAVLTGIDGIGYDNVTINAGRGFIEVSGAEQNTVYSAEGTIVGSSDSRYELPSGIYIVRADGTTRKVVVR